MNREENIFLPTLIGACFTVIVSLIAVIIFSVIVKNFNISSTVIKTVNQFIKSITIFAGCMIFVLGSGGIYKGAILGGISSVILQLIFSLIAGSFIGFKTIFIDLIFCAVIGGICGIISVNLKK
jgi:putative membrane protein (TIGR04086 family)